MNLTNLKPEDRDEFCDHIREACFHLASCWDALRLAELLTESEIETDELELLVGDMNDPGSAHKMPDGLLFDYLQRTEA